VENPVGVSLVFFPFIQPLAQFVKPINTEFVIDPEKDKHASGQSGRLSKDGNK
jgi:hypothetical protein